jgi:glutathione S-transferase
MNNPLPVLYSFRRCPYAIRTRFTIAYAGIPVEIREIELKNKPLELLALSPKATVPVLQLPNGKVLEESLDIMLWALAQHDPEHWLTYVDDAMTMIQWNDGDFKYFLDRYKYADRYPEHPAGYYRQQGELFLAELENRLAENPFLCGKDFCLADAAIFPFVRQFAAVDGPWFQTSIYTALEQWLDNILASTLFHAVMVKYPVWQSAQVGIGIYTSNNDN